MKPVRHDRDLGVHTAHIRPLAGLTVVGGNKAHGNRYEPTPYGVLDELLDALDLRWSDYSFVDLGSGQGRVLCMAARRPFKAVLGVEFAAELHDDALRNLDRLPASARRCRDVRAILGDAAEAELPAGPLIVYLFNPFGDVVLRRVLARLEADHTDDVYLLYYWPMQDDVFGDRWTPVENGGDWTIFALRR